MAAATAAVKADYNTPVYEEYVSGEVLSRDFALNNRSTDEEFAQKFLNSFDDGNLVSSEAMWSDINAQKLSRRMSNGI
jgi:hypothetical protein